ncbi:MAG: energy transducer TonB [Bacteroidota bacterium]|nr:energy transducer TonB [Bacteroidota bacterium]
MDSKKNKHVNLERFRLLFFQVSLIIVLISLVIVFNTKWSKKEDPEVYGLSFAENIMSDISLENTVGKVKAHTESSNRIKITKDDTPITDSVLVDNEAENTGNINQTNGNSNNTLYSAEVMPEYPGGITALKRDIAKVIQLPEEISTGQISGTVYVQFTVNQNGRPEEFVIKKSLHQTLDKEVIQALRLLKNFKPARQNGKPVAVYFILPLSFNI